MFYMCDDNPKRCPAIYCLNNHHHELLGKICLLEKQISVLVAVGGVADNEVG